MFVALVSAAAFLPITVSTANAQVQPAVPEQRGSPHRVWIAAGFGGGSAMDGTGNAGLVAQIVYERAPHHFALRALGLADLVGSADSGLAEVGLLYGRVATGNMGFAAASAGASAVYFDDSGGCSRRCVTAGIPLVLEMALTPLDVLGIGLQLFGNVNLRSPFAGLFIIIPLGWMP